MARTGRQGDRDAGARRLHLSGRWPAVSALCPVHQDGIRQRDSRAALHAFRATPDCWRSTRRSFASHGKIGESLDATKQALALDSTMAQGQLMVAQLELELGRPDSALVALRRAIAGGEDSSLVAQFALAKGNAMYRAANDTKTSADFGLALALSRLRRQRAFHAAVEVSRRRVGAGRGTGSAHRGDEADGQGGKLPPGATWRRTWCRWPAPDCRPDRSCTRTPRSSRWSISTSSTRTSRRRRRRIAELHRLRHLRLFHALPVRRLGVGRVSSSRLMMPVSSHACSPLHHLLRHAVHLRVVVAVESVEQLTDSHPRRAAEQIGERRRVLVPLLARASARARTTPSSRTARRRCPRRGTARAGAARALVPAAPSRERSRAPAFARAARRSACGPPACRTRRTIPAPAPCPPTAPGTRWDRTSSRARTPRPCPPLKNPYRRARTPS